MTGRVGKGIVLRRAWDRFALAWPFTRVDVVLGAPIEPAASGARDAVERALQEMNRDSLAA
jgi:lysophospholipid acyltransferase (LPLAT)-like uncharacterized protein